MLVCMTASEDFTLPHKVMAQVFRVAGEPNLRNSHGFFQNGGRRHPPNDLNYVCAKI